MDHPTLVGIGGLPRSGKDSLAELFRASGYSAISLGDILREYARQRHHDKPDPISLANANETATWLRTTQGNASLLRIALDRYERARRSEHDGLVLFSIRARSEVEFIRSRGGELIWVEASRQVRYLRAMMHLRQGEAPIYFQKFVHQEQLQWHPRIGLATDAQMDVAFVKKRATKRIVNNGDDLEAYLNRARRLVESLRGGHAVVVDSSAA